MDRIRNRIIVRGVVQGVGFRPFVYRTAVSLGLAGEVRNRGDAGVEIFVEGSVEDVGAFLERLRREHPPLARIDAIDVEPCTVTGQRGFTIVPSEPGGVAAGLIPPDTAMCDACRTEILGNSRFSGYWATSCTDCGPRFTVIEALPYDRPMTSMRDFPMCPACRSEYTDPLDRRYHAQTTACPACGPRLAFDGEPGDDAMDAACLALLAGESVAIQGIGGTHLACDATREGAVARLRTRLGRPHQPLAVMVRGQDLSSIANVAEEEDAWLRSPERPIVVVEKRPGALPEIIAPGLHTLGVMLPYSGLHILLLDRLRRPLVMTSANLPGQPMAIEPEAVDRMRGRLADHALTHERRIVARCDDSVVRRSAGRRLFIRRSRGFTPDRLAIDLGEGTILAVGPETGVAAALYASGAVTLTQFIGSVSQIDTFGFLKQATEHLRSLLGAALPRTIACDAHPAFITTRWAEEWAPTVGARVVPVQHHAAHMLSVMAEHGLEQGVGIILDGYGYGVDGAAWGGELLVAAERSISRHGALRPIPLPGADAAARFPLRLALAYLHEAGWDPVDIEGSLVARGMAAGDVATILHQIERRVNTPATTSAGRFLDAVSAWLGLCSERTYEGEPAMRLEAAAACGTALAWDVEVRSEDGFIIVDLVDLFSRLAHLAQCVPASVVAATAQHGLAKGVAQAALRISQSTGIRAICVSGGVAYNDRILSTIRQEVEEAGCSFYTNEWAPSGDGGVALGQAVFAGREWQWA